MKIPKKIKIGGRTFKVKLLNQVMFKGEEVGGVISFFDGTIEVTKRKSEDHNKQVFLHEIVHDIFEVIGMEQNEDNVDGIAHFLLQVIPQIEGKNTASIKRLMIAGKTYEVRLVNEVDECNNEGEISYINSTIKIKNHGSEEHKMQCFLHEIVHGIFDVLGIEQDENNVDGIAHLLLQVIPQIEGK